METKELARRLRNMAEITLDSQFSEYLNEASNRLEDMERQIEVLKARSMTVTVTLSAERIKEMMNEAFINCTGKDMDYVVQAVKEKLEREGELNVEEEAQEQSEA